MKERREVIQSIMNNKGGRDSEGIEILNRKRERYIGNKILELWLKWTNKRAVYVLCFILCMFTKIQQNVCLSV